jgi:hypothetical protein
MDRFNKRRAAALCNEVSGSGLNSKPEIRAGKSVITVYWDFNLMNQHGYYIGYWHFKVVIPKADPLNFKLYGRRGNTRCLEAHDMKDYLGEMFDSAMCGLLGKFGISHEWRCDKESQGYIYYGEVDKDDDE